MASDSSSLISDDSDSSSVASEKPDAETLKQYCLGAMRGEFIPPKLHYSNVEASMVHGLRYHEAFAESESVKELCTTSSEKIFTRARNARLIMSNKIPPMTDDEEKPYCIWHPDVATVDTYRELAQRYPDMRYHVGRACAVGGYIDLYRELDLLPDISIAEEAFHNTNSVGAKEIYDYIMCQPTRYAVLNDYERSVNLESPRIAAGLNGDTAVVSSLNRKVDISRGWDIERFHYFNITEDCSIGETSSDASESSQVYSPPLAMQHVPLLYNPLPYNLPTTNKDALILHAAYEGNVDRYARLRRPSMIEAEAEAATRGIYHNTSFARWWQDQLESGDRRACGGIPNAIKARFIMVNDISRITTPINENPIWGRYMPFMIWWPLIPQEFTLRELALRRPDMQLQIAITCIIADYRLLWEELKPDPHWLLWCQASGFIDAGSRANRNFYVEDLERRAAEQNINLRSYPESGWNEEEDCIRRDKEPTTTMVPSAIQATWDVLVDIHAGTIYGERAQANAARWDLYIAVPDHIREMARTKDGVSLWDPYGYGYSGPAYGSD
jgi:hypothetical protein